MLSPTTHSSPSMSARASPIPDSLVSSAVADTDISLAANTAGDSVRTPAATAPPNASGPVAPPRKSLDMLCKTALAAALATNAAGASVPPPTLPVCAGRVVFLRAAGSLVPKSSPKSAPPLNAPSLTSAPAAPAVTSTDSSVPPSSMKSSA